MNYFWFLFRFEGRINRAKYWLAQPIFACWMLVVLMVMAGIATIFGAADRKFSIGFSLLTSAFWHGVQVRLWISQRDFLAERDNIDISSPNQPFLQSLDL